MTKDKDFKRLVRSRMTATGENFTSARAALLGSTAAEGASETDHAGIDPRIARFRTKTLATFMPEGRIIAIPTKRRALVVLLVEVLAAFDADRIYSEKQVNRVLADFHPDFARLRRELIDYRLLERNSHTGQYWVNANPPEHTGSQAQEMAGLGAFLR
ncbi:DUF2087 domain-containing protein [Brevibacterium renqingii]|uniref:DUF2087 domain-containing protein n=1 Tax=Brevibacterium renqingii TaxID=2776916 RepID=UPI001ADF2C80|nr:DUF2087 domain-containing protein [Brevibacterium renqingii]